VVDRYYVGDNGLTLFNFGPTAFQNLMYQAAGDSETLEFLGRTRSINSIVLLSNGISFALQVVIFLILGSFADFGSWRPNILIVLSIIAFGIGFGWLGVHTEDKWHVGVGLYIVGLIAYQTTVTFWTAAFPGLARNTKELRIKAEEFAEGRITRKFISQILASDVDELLLFIVTTIMRVLQSHREFQHYLKSVK
jgi:MFS-type transporter involved in bile tolerance (Atg22 family)